MGDVEDDGSMTARAVEYVVRKSGVKDKVIVERGAAQGLPPGWIKEIRITERGSRVRRDPYYTDPKSGYIFRSFKDASRYLKTGKIGRHAMKPKDNSQYEVNTEDPKTSSNFGQTEKDEEELSSLGDSKQVQSSSSEPAPDDCSMSPKPSGTGLPPGWIKEIRITKKGSRVRRDPYYTDPKSGYVFRSFKDVSRYLKTGKIGRHAKKPKHNSQDEVHTEDAKIYTEKDEKKFSSVGDSKQVQLSSSEPTPDDRPMSPKPSSSRSALNAKEPERTEGTKDFKESKDMSSPEVGTTPDEQLSEEEVTRSQSTKNNSKLKRRKELSNLPRRASKRLAGIALELTPELKTRNNACQIAAERSDEAKAIKCEGPSPKTKSALNGCQKTETRLVTTYTRRNAVNRTEEAIGRKLEASSPEANFVLDISRKTEISSGLNKNKPLSGDHVSTVSDGHGKKVKERINVLKDNQESCAAVLNSSELTVRGTSLSEPNTKKVDDDTSGPSLDLPLADLWNDPCIAFAIKTLTGESLDPPDFLEVSANSKKDSRRSDHDKKQAIPEMPENLNKINEKPGVSLELPDASIWTDPCIEFAIKTLTGAIPIWFDSDAQSSKPQQQPVISSPSSLQAPAVNGFRQTDYSCHQFNITRKPAAGGAYLQQCETSSARRVTGSFSKS